MYTYVSDEILDCTRDERISSSSNCQQSREINNVICTLASVTCSETQTSDHNLCSVSWEAGNIWKHVEDMESELIS